MLCRLESLVNARRGLFCSKDSAVILALNLVIGYMFNNHRCLLLVDKANDFGDKFFRICFVHSKLHRRDALDNFYDSLSRQNGSFRNFANKVVFDLAYFATLQCSRACLCRLKCFTTLQSVCVHFICLLALGKRVGQLGNKQFAINVLDGFLD